MINYYIIDAKGLERERWKEGGRGRWRETDFRLKEFK